MEKMVNATFASIFTPPVFGMQMWHLPSLPYIYLSVFTYLRKSIFSSSVGNVAILSLPTDVLRGSHSFLRGGEMST